jgi:menaquinone-dependent protoporphyrinogen oxidase
LSRAKTALIVYGTRYGAAKGTAEKIGETLRKEGLEVKVVEAKREKVYNLQEYDLVIVGIGIQINRWTGEPQKFLNRFKKELTKKVALFVCCGSANPIDDSEREKTIENAREKYLVDVAAKYDLEPISLGLFGGVYDFNKNPWWSRKVMEVERAKFVAAGLEEAAPGVYDLRDLDAVCNWASEVAELV